ncbi:MAG: hypothetical protein AAFW00_19765 [Bacteroidota bacterium]
MNQEQPTPTPQTPESPKPDYEALYHQQLAENQKLIKVLRTLVMTVKPVLDLMNAFVDGAQGMQISDMIGKVTKMVYKIRKDKAKTPFIVFIAEQFGHKISAEEGATVMQNAIKSATLINTYANVFEKEELEGDQDLKVIE